MAAAGPQALTGHVTGQGGAPIPLASVYVHKLAGEPFDAKSPIGPSGEFSFDALPDGNYAVRALSDGFVSVSYEPVRVRFPRQVRLNFTLLVADIGSGDGVYT
jgi:hypothetical protein